MYLLLRNNKQSGPYSLEELKSMGLKAYDLVWLEGKSAAWRYPCEIEDLKAFAPVVEEQPFDRFYKKASATAASSSTTLAAKPTTDAPIPVTVESSRNAGKRIIYVTMPAARNTTPIIQPARESQSPARVTSVPVPVPVTAPPKQTYVERVAIEDYSAQLMEESAPAVEYTPRHGRSPRVIRLLAVGACILALLAAGIIIGLNLNKDTLGFPARVVAKLPPAATDQSIVHPTAQSLPAPATTPLTDSARSTDTMAAIVAQPAATRTTPKLPGVRMPKEKSAVAKNQVNNLPPSKDSVTGAAGGTYAVRQTVVAEPQHANTEMADKEAVKAALATQVSVGANGYSVGTFGGITGLQLTVTNRSVYPLDLVIVEVQYIQANKKVFKTENLYFHSIGAGSALMQEAPKSSRGVKVQYKITAISSKDLGLSYSGI